MHAAARLKAGPTAEVPAAVVHAPASELPSWIEGIKAEPGHGATAGGGEAAAKEAAEHVSREALVPAAAALAEAIRLEADKMRSLQNRGNLGCVLNRLGATRKAREVLEGALQLHASLLPHVPPAPHPAHQHLRRLACVLHVNLCCTAKDSDARRWHAQEALRLEPTNSEALFQVSLALQAEGDLQGAWRHLEQALRQNPEDQQSLGAAVGCLERLDRHQEALTMFERLCRLDAACIYAGLREVFRCRREDLVVCTYPRCGTTWMVQLTVCLLHGLEADREEHALFVEGVLASQPSQIWRLEQMPPPRILKMHAPADMFPGLARDDSPTALQPHGKTIYVVRNPKDTLVSLRHHHANNPAISFRGSWDDWVDSWLRGDRSLEYGGTWFEHVKGWWRLAQQHPGRVHLVYFEDMKADLAAVVAGVARFLGVEVGPSEAAEVAERCGFEAMKAGYRPDEALHGRMNTEHFRRGEVGSWRESLSDEQAARVDAATWAHLRGELAEGLRICELPPEA